MFRFVDGSRRGRASSSPSAKLVASAAIEMRSAPAHRKLGASIAQTELT
jgi:hypothetical protein